MTLQESFDEVICYSQNLPQVHTDNLFNLWRAAKAPFIDYLGDSYIYECPDRISIPLDIETKEQRINAFIEQVSNISDEIGAFLAIQKAGIYENKTVIDMKNPPIPSGLKLGKALHRYYSSYCSSEKLDWIINELSRLIQEATITGRLCISVHPLDFLSASENTHNWRSCHSLDGEYRAGNLSYMCDDSTAIVYLKSDEPAILPNFPSSVPWNNKKWRCFLHWDRQRKIIWASRHYPFYCRDLLNIINNSILTKFHYFDSKAFVSKQNEWAPHTTFKTLKLNNKDYYLSTPYLFFNSEIYPMSNFVRNHPKSCAYNDLLNSHSYTPDYLSYSYYSHMNIAGEPLTIGAEATCVRCGQITPFYDSSYMFCEDCAAECLPDDSDAISYCSLCGNRFLTEEGYSYNDEIICSSCYHDLEITECPNCGLAFPLEEGYEGRNQNVFCCRSCAQEFEN